MTDQLTRDEVRALDSVHPYAMHRFKRYRGQGFSHEEAVSYALAWGRNESEERARRVSHGTGATR